MAAIASITLGGVAYIFRPLTIRQLRDLGLGTERRREIYAQPAGPEREGAVFDNMVEAIALALVRDHPELTAGALLDVEADMQEVFAAYRAVLVASGFVPKSEPALGEAPAAS